MPYKVSDPRSDSEILTISGNPASLSVNTTHLTAVLTLYGAIEFFASACSAFFASILYHYFTWHLWPDNTRYILAAATVASLILLVSIGLHAFSAVHRQARHVFVWKGIGAVALSFSSFLTVLFFAQLSEGYSRGSLIFQIVSVSIAVVGSRTLFYSWLRNATASSRIQARRVALVGDASHCSKFSSRLTASGIKTVGFFKLPVKHNINGISVGGQTVREIISNIRPHRVDDVIVLANNEIMPTIFELSSLLAELPAGIHIVPIDAPNALASSQIAELGNMQTLQIHRPPLSTFDLCLKRAFDVAFATIGLIVLSPLFLIVSIAIKLDSPGPVFFRNMRHGFNNEEIGVLKFRSMTSVEDGRQFTQVIENDPRVTRIGRIIRRTNIDELPQLINVLRGEMSLVGPRPHATAHNALFNEVIAPFSRRHNVKPGITGWAQVNGYRGVTDAFEKMQRRIEYDLYYIDNWSFLFDIEIMLMTLFSKKAYINAY